MGLLRSCATPVIWTRHCEFRRVLNAGRDKHCFVTRQYRLAECDAAASFVLAPYRPCTAHTVGLIRERLLNIPILVAIEASVLLPVSMRIKEGWRAVPTID